MMKLLPTIGIECHVQLKTKTKLFAAVDNDARNVEPNSLVSPICFGLPGTLPVLNSQALTLAIKAGHALNAEIALESVFDRKHYFYPDLPKGYQISQYHQPIINGGFVEVQSPNGDSKKVALTRAHLEEDAGKLTHLAGQDYSTVDLNRAGTPLLEIVSEAEMHSSQEAKAYAKELYYLMIYAGVSDGDLYHGNIRFDVNISLAEAGATELGKRAEVKNLNSFKAVERAVEYEITRQSKLLESGKFVDQETRGWDEAKQATTAQRSKEEAHDYRYFPDPDIPPVVLNKKEIDSAKSQLPIMPKERRVRFAKMGLAYAQIETLIDQKEFGDVVLEVLDKDSSLAKRVANTLCGPVASKQTTLKGTKLNTARLVQLAKLAEEGGLNSNAVDIIAVAMLTSSASPSEIAKSKGLEQVSDDAQLLLWVAEVLKKNSPAVTQYLAGETKVLKFLVGQVMALSKGSAHPQKVTDMLNKQLKLPD